VRVRGSGRVSDGVIGARGRQDAKSKQAQKKPPSAGAESLRKVQGYSASSSCCAGSSVSSLIFASRALE
jgi:hypothetical protein